MSAKLLILTGTKKGLFIYSSDDRRKWSLRGPFLSGKEINHAVRDPRTGRIFATANDAFFGSELKWSDDLGKTWKSPKRSPVFDATPRPLHGKPGEPATGAVGALTLERLWHVAPGRAGEPGVLYCGVAPAALFRSADNGQTWGAKQRITFVNAPNGWATHSKSWAYGSTVHLAWTDA
ncbi:MAG: exo-alpha-sialidase, partial [Verrucomicrobia bacterium]|nr:exo-alpha-sialidase [Verrucomicrobiota bacterium]